MLLLSLPVETRNSLSSNPTSQSLLSFKMVYVVVQGGGLYSWDLLKTSNNEVCPQSREMALFMLHKINT